MPETRSTQEQSGILDSSSKASLPTDDIQGDGPQGNELPKAPSKPEYPSTDKVLVIVAGIFLCGFFIALDRFIISVAIPRITDEFHSLGDVGWYGSAYLLTSCAFMLSMGRVYTLYNPKWVYLSSVVVFEVGSAVCGAAPNSKALIIGRAVAGLGVAGLYQGSIIILVYVIPLHKRPKYMGVVGMVFGIASAVGPLLGGAFTDGPGWRWCFFVNLPCGAVVFILLAIFLRIPAAMLQQKPTTFREKTTRLDPLGTFFFLPCIICLLLALEWGGVTYKWADVRIIVLLVLSGTLFVAFLFVQRWKGEGAMVPGHIFFNRSIIAGVWFSFCIGGSMQTLFYYLPIWFQAIKGASALKSGIMSLPLVLGMSIASIVAGILTKKIGYFTPWMIATSIVTPIAAGLISTLTPHTAHPAWIGYQALFGLGFGMGNQQPSVAAQTVLPRKDVPIGASLMQFSQILGGAVFLSVGNNIFDSQLARNLAKVPGIDVGSVVDAGATELRKMVSSTKLPLVLVAYNNALRATFYLTVALTCLLIFGAASMEWKSVKRDQQKEISGAKDGEKKSEQV